MCARTHRLLNQRRVKSRTLHLHPLHQTLRLRHRLAPRPQPVQMERDRFGQRCFHARDTRPRCHATRQIRHIPRIPCTRFFDQDRIAHFQCPFNFACFKIELKVPLAKSSLSLPATVTRPGLDGCSNWRWLPRVPTRIQPSSASMCRTNLIFTTGMTNS